MTDRRDEFTGEDHAEATQRRVYNPRMSRGLRNALVSAGFLVALTAAGLYSHVKGCDSGTRRFYDLQSAGITELEDHQPGQLLMELQERYAQQRDNEQ